MQAPEQPVDPQLLERIDGLQTRVEHLEDLLLAHDEPAETLPMATVAASTATPVPEIRAATEAGPAHDDGPAVPDTYGSLLDEWQRGAAVDKKETGNTGIDLAYIEDRLAGRALALVGGAALILGAIFFLSLAFSRGWIGPSMQVAMGLLGGLMGLLIGGFLLMRGDRVVGHVLSAVGLAVISLSLFAATSLYGLVDPAVGLAGTLAVAALTTVIAVAARSQIVAAFGLIAVLAAPPVLGATMDQTTLGYMIIVLGGVAAVSLWQTWSWLPSLAFVISAPQVFLWVSSDPAAELVFVGLLGYWLLLAISAGGESFRRARPELSLASAPLFMAAGAFVIASAFTALGQTSQQVGFLLTLATLHVAVAAWFFMRRGPVDPFGLLAGAFGLAIASMAVPLVFGASMTAVVWSAEAAALAVVAVDRRHGPSLLGALALLSIAGVRLASLAVAADPGRFVAIEPLLGQFGTLVIGWGFFLAAGVVFATVVPSRPVRLGVVVVATLTTIPIIDSELDGVALVAASSALALVTLAAPRWLALLPEHRLEWRLGPALEWLRPKQSPIDSAVLLSRIAAAVAAFLALLTTIGITLEQGGAGEVPFGDEAGTSALVLAIGCVLAGIIVNDPAHRRLGAIAAIAVLGLAVIYQLPAASTVVLWTVLAAVAFALGRIDGRGLVSFVIAGAVIVFVAATTAATMAWPDRLFVSSGGVPPHPLLISEATVVLGAVALALAFASRVHAAARWSDWALAASGIAALYLLSIAVVDVFATEAYGLDWRAQRQIDALAKEAHVALSVLWSVTGVVVTAAGLLLKRAALRVAGLAVLTLATAKVFLFDLASLDIAYRVITLIVLGVLLIASAWAWGRLKPPAPPPSQGQASPAA